jgi:hypothetical protein
MNPLIESLIVDQNIPENSILLLLMLPIVATIIAFWRQIIGLRTFGIYAPIVITFAFYQLGITQDGISLGRGLKYGWALALVVFFSAAFAHELTRKIRLHYLPKMSIVLSIVAIAVFGMLILASYLNRWGFISVDILPLLLMITVSEQLISIYIKKGRKATYILTLGTLLISTLSFILISWENLQDFILKYPHFVLITFILNLIIGRWAGFRLKEFFRFKTLLTESETD